ncbi:acid cluster protein 33 homologue, putative [Plasmodium vinckei brucechwatti]|uniref:Maspardin n=1 Tax=Plasmodium vinckei brucechwatti TaxID=119398 RepID=A0A6V7SKZ6_PLAVN|nr:acid cluster protein 33 homologue, putative [Plasmodium vinckei brucechwatti]
MELDKLSMHEAYKEFCSRHPLKKLSMPKSDLVWSYYDINSRNEHAVIFLHGICGTAGCYFYQLEKLSNLGFRVISLQYPCYNYLQDWIKNMCNILEYLNIKKAHFFAADLGGYLIQLYAKLYPSKIGSLILCNSYRQTEGFAAIASIRSIYGKLYSFLPHVLLKKIIIEDYIYGDCRYTDLKEKNSLEFMSNEIDLISASDLGGRISLQLSSDVVDSIYANDKCITVMQTLNNMYPDSINDDMKKAYPNAKHAIMKSGGPFPYLSRYDEVNMYILIHLKNNISDEYVKERIANMSYIEREKNCDDIINHYLGNKTRSSNRKEENTKKNLYNDNNTDVNNYSNYNNDTLGDTKVSYHSYSNYEQCSNKVIHGNNNNRNDNNKSTYFYNEWRMDDDIDDPKLAYENKYTMPIEKSYEQKKALEIIRSDMQSGIKTGMENDIKNHYRYKNEERDLNPYKYDSYNYDDNFSRKDTVTSEEVLEANEDNNYSYGGHYENEKKYNIYKNNHYANNEYNNDHDKTNQYNINDSNYKNNDNVTYSKKSLYEENFNKSNLDIVNFIDDKHGNISKKSNINLKGSHFNTSYNNNRNTTYEDIPYDNNNEYTYTSNENFNDTNQKVSNSEDYYNRVYAKKNYAYYHL